MSPRLFALGLGLAVAGCAVPAALDAPANHPARVDAPTAALAVEIAALPPVAPPAVPAVLRPHGVDHDATTDRPAMTMEADEASMSHTAMNHGATVLETPSPTPDVRLGDVPPAPLALANALDAYLAVHDALADDRLDADAARALAAAFDVLVETPPAGDAHFWHTRGEIVAGVRQSARALAEADDLDAARAAFGTLSAPFAEAVDALGTPAGLDLVRHTCGMADAPEGGVWLQRQGPPRNPYFGTRMRMCRRSTDDVPTMDHGSMGGMSHEGHR
ncbi:hypothetical protein [Rubrivirga sp.]|uniref:hypothetical protein n=1 Tax=Rubrivirga sp. TaxID=1885344 RepID=UPI003B52540E